MKKQLEHDYELDRPPSGLVPHFWDTINVLGGWKGLLVLSIGILIFYLLVDYVITSGRQRREAKAQRKNKVHDEKHSSSSRHPQQPNTKTNVEKTVKHLNMFSISDLARKASTTTNSILEVKPVEEFDSNAEKESLQLEESERDKEFRQHSQLVASIYEKYTFNDILSASTGCRKELEYESTTLSYSEVDIESFLRLMVKLRAEFGAKCSFVDLGCGAGKLVVALFTQGTFSRCWGIEILPGMYKFGAHGIREMKRLIKGIETELIRFTLADFTFIDWSSSDLVFFYVACVEDYMMTRMAEIANKMKAGSIIVAVINKLTDEFHFELIETTSLIVNWGKATTYIYKRTNKDSGDVILNAKIKLQEILRS